VIKNCFYRIESIVVLHLSASQNYSSIDILYTHRTYLQTVARGYWRCGCTMFARTQFIRQRRFLKPILRGARDHDRVSVRRFVLTRVISCVRAWKVYTFERAHSRSHLRSAWRLRPRNVNVM